jgi:glutaminyl-tRNA synthetase
MPNFIENYWNENAHLWNGELVTRFPPEPNGYSHLGHAKALGISFGLAEKFGGKCHLRMDDTNPEAESEEFVAAIKEMVEWLGWTWDGDVKYTSDYFPFIYEVAKKLTAEGSAYVDFSDRETMREMRGSFTVPGHRSLDADKPSSWHMEKFEAMAAGAFDEGACVLRAKIDMASPNMNLRDPVIYRIKTAPHHRTGTAWKVMPSYDYAHPASDFYEGTTLSLCSLEFEDHRPFYDWVVAKCAALMPSHRSAKPPVELEFARLELDRGLTSKRKINVLVEEGKVDGWDDPRLVTLAGLRRRGFTPSSIRKFCEESGVSKANSTTPISRLEDFLRLDLDPVAPRRLVVARPVPLDVVDGGPSAPFEALAPNHPKNESMGTRPFEVSSHWWIDREDVRAAGCAEKGFKRVEPGAVFRIMHAMVMECVSVEVDAAGAVLRVVAKPSEAKPRATIHGLSKGAAKPVEIWEPEVVSESDEDPSRLLVIRSGYAEPLALSTPGTWHAVRYGYCVADARSDDRLILSTGLRGVS